jgi:hypothetical protein
MIVSFRRKFGSVANAILLLTIGLYCSASSANAGTLYTFTSGSCTTGCNSIYFGTVSLVQIGPNKVHVTVGLGPDYSFRLSNDANHKSFAFNLNASIGTALIDNITSGDPSAKTFSTAGPGSFNMAGFGAFQYNLTCTTCISGTPTAANATHRLDFDVTATGLTESGFVGNASNWFFAADVVGGLIDPTDVNLTGNLAATAPAVFVPEPATCTMVLGGLGLAAWWRRRHVTA